MGRALTIFFGLLAFGLLIWVCLGHREGIQREIADNTKAALVADGHDFARVSAEGQTVVLRGTATTAAQKEAAEVTAAAVPGVVAVDNQIAVLTDVPPPGPDSKPIVREPIVEEPQPPEVVEVSPEPILETLQIQLDGETQVAVVTGFTLSDSTEDGRSQRISDSISASLPDWRVTGELIAAANQPTDLLIAVQQVLPTLAGATRAQIDVDLSGIRVNAELPSFVDRTALEATLDGLNTELKAQDLLASSTLSWTLDSPDAVPPARAQADGCQKAFDELLGSDSIKFTTSRADIRPGSIPLLDKLVEVAGDCDVNIAIEGHTDSRGSVELNNALSQARAESVRGYLIDNGVDAERVSASGFGSAQPIADNNTINGRQANRRIEFRVQRTEP